MLKFSDPYAFVLHGLQIGTDLSKIRHFSLMSRWLERSVESIQSEIVPACGSNFAYTNLLFSPLFEPLIQVDLIGLPPDLNTPQIGLGKEDPFQISVKTLNGKYVLFSVWALDFIKYLK